MVGLLLGAVQENETGKTIIQQLQSPTIKTILLVVLTVYASLVPILKGAKREPFGIFTPRAEIVNARAAMLGFGILLLLEAKAGVPFF